MIKKKTIETLIYVGDNGKETPVEQMHTNHLVNALVKTARKFQACPVNEHRMLASLKETVDALKNEVLKRLNVLSDEEESA